MPGRLRGDGDGLRMDGGGRMPGREGGMGDRLGMDTGGGILRIDEEIGKGWRRGGGGLESWRA